MIANSLEINEALLFEPIEPDQISEAIKRKDACVWLDLQAFEPKELEAWLDRLGVTGLSRQLCLEANDRPGFYPLKNELVLVIPVLADTASQKELDHLAFLCKENLLLTFHSKTLLSPQRMSELDESAAWLTERSISGLVSAVLIDLSIQCLQKTARLRDSIVALENRMDRDPDTVEAEEILDLRAELLALGSVVSDQLPSLQALSATEKSFFNLKNAREYMNCAVANLQAAQGSLSRLDARISDIRSGFQMHAQEKANRRLGMLTILSAIFMPITLLAGVWGMNFENMPELKIPFSYPIALGLMALIGWGMYRYFRKFGWLE